MNTRERKLTSVLYVCLGILIVFFFALVIWPKYQDMSKKADAATTAKNEAEARLKHAEELNKNKDEINDRLVNLQARIPSSLELSNVINRFDEIAVQNNLIWLQGTPEDNSLAASGSATAAQASTIAPQLTRHNFTIVVQGALPDFIKFMSNLTDKNIGRVIIISSVDLSFKEDMGPQAIEATLKLEVIGWDKGADIDSGGCVITTPGENVSADDPQCNRTNVSKDSESQN